jgi:hypothetical protein
MRMAPWAHLAVVGMVAGCNPSAPEPPRESGVKINAPGVRVDVERDGKVKVDAPGVKVDVRPK